MNSLVQIDDAEQIRSVTNVFPKSIYLTRVMLKTTISKQGHFTYRHPHIHLRAIKHKVLLS